MHVPFDARQPPHEKDRRTHASRLLRGPARCKMPDARCKVGAHRAGVRGAGDDGAKVEIF